MKSPAMLLLAFGLFLSGCAATTNSRSRSSTPTIPAGPVTTSVAAPSMIGAGTSLVVRTTEAISSARDTPGKTYAAEVSNDIVDQGGTILVPKGSPVQLTVVAASADLQLALLSMTVNGKTYQVTSATTEGAAGPEGRAPNRPVTEKGRKGALLGTATSTTAGGGAASGQIVTRGTDVRVPAESVITFRLQETIQLVGHTP